LEQLIDFILNIDEHLVTIIEKFGPLSYLVLFGIIFAETGLVITPFLPGDSLLFAAGALAARGGFNIYYLYITLLFASIIGDSCNYWIGRKLGIKAFRKIPAFKEEHLEQTKEYFKEHGKKTVVVARFMPIIRTFAPFVAGISHMDYKLFLTFSITGSFLWITLFTFLGYFFGNLPWVEKNFTLAIMIMIILSFIPSFYHYLKNRKKNANRKKSPKK